MMDLVHSHNYIALYEQQKQKNWRQSTGMVVRDAVGRRVGVLGYGSIGRQGQFTLSLLWKLSEHIPPCLCYTTSFSSGD
jgi:phosphoglycerate dehydrogenase-like enzyme